MTDTTLNAKPFNVALIGSEAANNTKVVWVSISDCLSSASMSWFYDQKSALTSFENDKKNMPEGMQALLFPFEVRAELTPEQITEAIDEFYTEFEHDINFLSNENVMSAPHSPDEWVKKSRIYDNKCLLATSRKVFEPHTLLCSNWTETNNELLSLRKRNIKPFVKQVGSEVHLVWSEPQVNTLYFVYFDTNGDVGLVLNNHLVSYHDYDNEEFRRLMTTLEKSLETKVLCARFSIPKTEEWQDWNWDMVMDVIVNKPDFDGLISLHTLEDTVN